jgi:hypothetical protein
VRTYRARWARLIHVVGVNFDSPSMIIRIATRYRLSLYLRAGTLQRFVGSTRRVGACFALDGSCLGAGFASLCKEANNWRCRNKHSMPRLLWLAPCRAVVRLIRAAPQADKSVSELLWR